MPAPWPRARNGATPERMVSETCPRSCPRPETQAAGPLTCSLVMNIIPVRPGPFPGEFRRRANTVVISELGGGRPGGWRWQRASTNISMPSSRHALQWPPVAGQGHGAVPGRVTVSLLVWNLTVGEGLSRPLFPLTWKVTTFGAMVALSTGRHCVSDGRIPTSPRHRVL